MSRPTSVSGACDSGGGGGGEGGLRAPARRAVLTIGWVFFGLYRAAARLARDSVGGVRVVLLCVSAVTALAANASWLATLFTESYFYTFGLYLFWLSVAELVIAVNSGIAAFHMRRITREHTRSMKGLRPREREGERALTLRPPRSQHIGLAQRQPAQRRRDRARVEQADAHAGH